MSTLRIKYTHYLYESSLFIRPRQHGRTKKKRLFPTGTGGPATKIL